MNQRICDGAHCKCMNLDGKCKNYHRGDHLCSHSEMPSQPEQLDDNSDVIYGPDIQSLATEMGGMSHRERCAAIAKLAEKQHSIGIKNGRMGYVHKSVVEQPNSEWLNNTRNELLRLRDEDGQPVVSSLIASDPAKLRALTLFVYRREQAAIDKAVTLARAEVIDWLTTDLIRFNERNWTIDTLALDAVVASGNASEYQKIKRDEIVIDRRAAHALTAILNNYKATLRAGKDKEENK